jgi:hypothetical protein
MPPELLELLAGGGAPAEAPMGPAEAPMPPDSGGVAPASSSSPAGGQQAAIEILKQMISLAQEYVQVEPDDIDKETMTKVLSTLQGYLAKNQKESEAAMGTTPALKGMRRAMGG